MGRPKKKPGYDSEKIVEQFTNCIAEAYMSGVGGGSANSLRQISEQFNITLMKARKILITTGAYHSDICDRIIKLKEEGKTIEEIMKMTNLSRASVHSYLPYSKAVYNSKEVSQYAERCRTYRLRKEIIRQLSSGILENSDNVEDTIWTAILLFNKYTFTMQNGEKFRYIINGEELYIIRKKTVITRNTINVALSVLMEKGEMLEVEWARFYGGKYVQAIFQKFEIT